MSKILIKYKDSKPPKPFKNIPLRGGFFAIVDAEDYDDLIKYDWFVYKTNVCYYAGRYEKTSGHNQLIPMHRHIKQTPAGFVEHHRNHNSLDNRKHNLLTCTPEEHCEFHPYLNWTQKTRKSVQKETAKSQIKPP